MPRYPAQYESEVMLSRGSAIHLSPIRPDDAIRLVDHSLVLSRRRIFTAPLRPDPFDTRYSADVDYVNDLERAQEYPMRSKRVMKRSYDWTTIVITMSHDVTGLSA